MIHCGNLGHPVGQPVQDFEVGVLFLLPVHFFHHTKCSALPPVPWGDTLQGHLSVSECDP